MRLDFDNTIKLACIKILKRNLTIMRIPGERKHFNYLYKFPVRFDVTLLSLFKFFGAHDICMHDEKLFTNSLIPMSVISTYLKRKSVHKPRNFRTERLLSVIVCIIENVREGIK